jgi:hypothetical protein
MEQNSNRAHIACLASAKTNRNHPYTEDICQQIKQIEITRQGEANSLSNRVNLN